MTPSLTDGLGGRVGEGVEVVAFVDCEVGTAAIALPPPEAEGLGDTSRVLLEPGDDAAVGGVRVPPWRSLSTLGAAAVPTGPRD